MQTENKLKTNFVEDNSFDNESNIYFPSHSSVVVPYQYSTSIATAASIMHLLKAAPTLKAGSKIDAIFGVWAQVWVKTKRWAPESHSENWTAGSQRRRIFQLV